MNKRWHIFATLAFLYSLAYFYRVSMAVTARDLVNDLHLSPTQLGTLSGAFFYAFACAQIPLGPLLDRYGGRILITITGAITAIGLTIFACSSSYPTALAGRILMGAGSACVLMGALKVFTNWFDSREFATISGLIIAIGNLGNLAATTPLALAIARFGWRTPFLTAAVVQAITTFLVYSWVRNHPHPNTISTEEDLPSAPKGLGLIEGWNTIFRSGSFWLLSLLVFFWYCSYMALQGLWGGPYLMEVVGLSRTGAGDILLFTSLGFIVGCLVVGKISDKMLKSRKKTLLAGQSALLLLMCLMLGPAETISKPLLSFIFFSLGVAVSSGVTMYPLLKEMFPLRITATALTTANFFVLMGAAVGQQTMGLIIESFPRGPAGYPAEAYHRAFLFPVCGLAAALCLFLFAKDTQPGKQPH